MRHRLVILIVIACVIPVAVFGQAKSPRTPDGQPDLQGIWSFATITPLERPADLAGKEFFTAKEAVDYENDVRKRNNMDRRDGSAEADVQRAYNDFWWDRGTRIVKTRRTSLVIAPSDGKIPPLTAAAKERQTERQAANRGHEFDGPENRPLQERCLMWVSTGPPMLPTSEFSWKTRFRSRVLRSRIFGFPGFATKRPDCVGSTMSVVMTAMWKSAGVATI